MITNSGSLSGSVLGSLIIIKWYSLRVFEDSDYSMVADDFPSLKECQSPFYHKMVISP